MKKSVLVMAVLLLVLLLVRVATAQEQERKEGKESKQARGVKVTRALLVGVWVPSGEMPEGATMNIEFTRDGKMKVFGQSKVKGEVKKYNHEGTYKIVKGGLKLTSRGPKGKERTEKLTVTKLTRTELVTHHARGGERVFKKKK
jgi:uncharacterized protein (TIGR03066 family)